MPRIGKKSDTKQKPEPVGRKVPATRAASKTVPLKPKAKKPISRSNKKITAETSPTAVISSPQTNVHDNTINSLDESHNDNSSEPTFKTNYDPNLAHLDILASDYSPRLHRQKRAARKRSRLISGGSTAEADESLTNSHVEEPAKKRKTARKDADIANNQNDSEILESDISHISVDGDPVSEQHKEKTAKNSEPKKRVVPPKKVQQKPRQRNAEQQKTFDKLLTKFSRDTDSNKAKCLIKDCNSSVSWRPSNLKRHLKLMHSTHYEKLFVEEVNAEKAARIELFNVIQDAVELVTVNGMPFSLMNSSGMRGFIESRLNALQSSGFKITLNRWNVVDEVEKISKHIENKIKAQMRDKMINLMLDISTQGTLAALGVNANYTVECETVCPSLGIVQINERHNAVNIANMLYDILAQYGVTLDRVFSITTDNGRNVVNSATVLDLIANSNRNSNQAAEDSNGGHIDFHESNEEEIRDVMDNAHDYSTVLNDVANDIIRSNEEIHSINHINCSTHTVQLGINDGLADSNALDVLDEAKEICTTMRTEIVMIEFRKIKGKKILPPMENSTRWNSRYLMVGTHSQFCSHKIIIIISFVFTFIHRYVIWSK